MKKFLTNLDNNIIGLLLGFMTVLIFVATVCRYTGVYNFVIADELSRYCLIWMIFLGISVGAKSGSHFAVTIVTEKLPSFLKKVVSVVRIIVVVAFNCTIAVQSFKLITQALRQHQTSPSMNAPMEIVYLALPLGCVLMAINYGIHGFQTIRGKAEDGNGEADL